MTFFRREDIDGSQPQAYKDQGKKLRVFYMKNESLKQGIKSSELTGDEGRDFVSLQRSDVANLKSREIFIQNQKEL